MNRFRTCPILSKNWPCFKCMHDSFLSNDGLAKKIIYSLLIIKTLKANFIGVIPNFLFWGIQVTIHMKNEDEGFFVAESAKHWVCYRVGWFFLVPIKLHFGLWYWSCSFAFRICYINKTIKFLLVVIVIDSTIFTKRYFDCTIFWVTNYLCIMPTSMTYE